MAAKKPLVIVTRKLPDVIETRLMELFDTRLNVTDKPMSKAALIEAVGQADVLLPTVTDRIDAGILAHANPTLRLIANFGAGVDKIDLRLFGAISPTETQQGSDTLVMLDSHDTLLLKNVTATSLHANDFILHAGA